MKKRTRDVMLFLGLLLTMCAITTSNAFADEVAISTLSISPPDHIQVGVPVTVTASAADAGGKTIYYKFYYCANYGTADYATTEWTVVQDYSTTNSATYTFSSSGNYIIVVRAVTEPTNEPLALPLAGQAVVVGDDSQVSLIGMTTDATTATNAGDTVTVTVTASELDSQTLYYQFYYCANYGTSYYDTTSWTLVQPYSTSNSCQYTFPSDGDYIIVARAVTDPNNEPAALPIVGSTISIGDPDVNHKPVANSISLSVNSTIPYFEQQLIGSDVDNDTVSYELLSSSSGTGYSLAYVNATTGMLYVSLEPSGSSSFSLSYRVTDGQLYSDPATVTVSVSYLSDDERDTGRNSVDPEAYSQFAISTYNSDLLGDVGTTPTQPQSVDLSPNFPTPGDQGRQSSCVGWATAYALKSFQEKIEMDWSLNTASHLFSPAFLYNQINYGQDQGSYINEALDLAVNKGLSTLATMPYSDTDYRSQPSEAALAEAAGFKASRWYRINDTSQIKAALVNRKPVVVGIAVYPQFNDLQGSDSVYNTATGTNGGGHAVTIVGYDDSRYGGAFKVINSWGQNWGDNGYFWMPYSFASQGIMSEAYVLVDAENGDTTVSEDPTEPVTDASTLPNLTVESWNASYDPRPRGAGTLTYSIINNGSATANAGADVNLMLSKNAEISSNDYYVIYETIPYNLAPGGSVYRDQNNTISFQFPDQLPTGTYYMALWVDDLDKVEESNEDDNVSLSSSQVTISNSLPDLNVNTWYADWESNGYGTLTYEVINSGGSTTTNTNWYVNLILDPDQVVGNGNEIFLFYETATYYLAPGEYIYRDGRNAAYFNLYRDYWGQSVPSGTYYMALWVDDQNAVEESNEMNNGSYSWNTVSITGTSLSANNIAANSLMAAPESDKGNHLSGKAYNGKKLPPASVTQRRVQISRTPSGGMTMRFLGQEELTEQKHGAQEILPAKTVSAGSSVISPVTKRMSMP